MKPDLKTQLTSAIKGTENIIQSCKKIKDEKSTAYFEGKLDTLKDVLDVIDGAQMTL